MQLTDHRRRFNIEVGLPHDGNYWNGAFYFTTTNGHVVGIDPATGQRISDADFNAIDKRHQQLGWCRGLRHIDDDHAIVGFGQFRRTKYKQLAHWILDDGKAALPSRLALYNLRQPKLLEEMTFSGRYDGLAIFSIFPWPE